MSAALADVARFAPADPHEVVLASFACPCCLRTPLIAVVDDRVAGCACTSCDQGWVVTLDDGQLLRLRLHPPPGLWLEWRTPM